MKELEQQLRGLEEHLMRIGTRSSRKNLEELFAADFVEFGSNGITYDREAVISALVLDQPIAWSIANFTVRVLAEDVALVTYTATKGGGQSSLRCSIWKRYDGRWKMAFHQGTSVAQ